MDRPSTFPSNISRHFSQSPSTSGALYPTPAELIKTSILPYMPRTFAHMCKMLSALRISTTSQWKIPPEAATSWRISSRLASRRPAPTTTSPAAASFMLTARPMPLVAPVTSATLPFQRCIPSRPISRFLESLSMNFVIIWFACSRTAASILVLEAHDAMVFICFRSRALSPASTASSGGATTLMGTEFLRFRLRGAAFAAA
mmetsp:Transcript_35053/g.58988  ORF Transcript_35053/g.58988 Transcript_35053/m.58988 type:complete len:202 (-) Transcript_35053:690-1295(-)